MEQLQASDQLQRQHPERPSLALHARRRSRGGRRAYGLPGGSRGEDDSHPAQPHGDDRLPATRFREYHGEPFGQPELAVAQQPSGRGTCNDPRLLPVLSVSYDAAEPRVPRLQLSEHGPAASAGVPQVCVRPSGDEHAVVHAAADTAREQAQLRARHGPVQLPRGSSEGAADVRHRPARRAHAVGGHGGVSVRRGLHAAAVQQRSARGQTHGWRERSSARPGAHSRPQRSRPSPGHVPGHERTLAHVAEPQRGPQRGPRAFARSQRPYADAVRPLQPP